GCGCRGEAVQGSKKDGGEDCEDESGSHGAECVRLEGWGSQGVGGPHPLIPSPATGEGLMFATVCGGLRRAVVVGRGAASCWSRFWWWLCGGPPGPLRPLRAATTDDRGGDGLWWLAR